MLEHLLTLLFTLKNIAYYSILFSYKTGQLIVFGLKASLHFLSSLWDTLWAAIVIVSEDFLVFTSDFSARLGSVVDTLGRSIDSAAHGVSTCLYLGYSGALQATEAVIAVHGIIVHILSRIIISVTNVFAALKQFCVLFGCGVWFAVTFIPISIVYVCITVTYCMGRFLEEFINITHSTLVNIGVVLTNIYHFITDVPAESTAGLIIAVCLSYVLARFNLMIFKTVRRTFMNIAVSLRAKIRTSVQQTPAIDNSGSNKNGTCVICFERNKCLLTMPCRHLCMCVECWEQLQNYQGGENPQSCPICRRFVQYTIHVY